MLNGPPLPESLGLWYPRAVRSIADPARVVTSPGDEPQVERSGEAASLSRAGVRSMTGQGEGQAALGAGASVLVEVRSVNHRWLEIRSRLPAELADHTGAVEDTVRRMLHRGRIDVGVRIDGQLASMPHLDVARARAAFHELTALRDAIAPSEAVPLSLLGTVPGLFSARDGSGHSDVREHVVRAAESACAAVLEMRAREGAALAYDLWMRAAEMDLRLAVIKERGPHVVAAVQRRLTERIERLLGEGRSGDSGRIEQEVALFADRSDVAEECTRLASHIAQLRGMLEGAPGKEAGPVGRRLEFLLQEMARESNTLGQKSADVEIARAVIDLKVEIERMREQAQNVL